MERARLKLQEHYQRSTEAWAEKQIALVGGGGGEVKIALLVDWGEGVF